MSDFWFYNKIFKDYVNKARLWDLMTTYKKQEKTQTCLELITKEKTQWCWSIICKKKNSQWYTCKGAQNKTKKKNVIVKKLEDTKQRSWMSHSSMW